MHQQFVSDDFARQRRDHLRAQAVEDRLVRTARGRPPRAMGTCCAGGQRLDVRVLERGDLGHVARLVERLSKRSRYLRFFSPLDRVPATLVEHLAAIDHDKHEAVGAFADGALVGSAHWFRSESDTASAEISLEVADSHQRHGVGPCLLRALARLAGQQGITRFTATVLAENHAAVAVLRRSGWHSSAHLSGPQLTIDLTLPEPATAVASTPVGADQ